MFAVLAEHTSDADAIAAIIKSHLKIQNKHIMTKGYDGCGAMCNKGARDVKSWLGRGVRRFVICHDADSNRPEVVYEKVLATIVRPSESQKYCCVTVPVQEIEAWLIADEAAITKVIPSFKFKGHTQPETIQSPKEWLMKQSNGENSKPRYAPAVHNELVAMQLDFATVSKKCPSFKAFIKRIDELSAA